MAKNSKKSYSSDNMMDDEDEDEKDEGKSQTPLPSKGTKFGFDKDSAEGGIAKLFLIGLGKLGEENPQEAFSVVQHLLTALGGAASQQSGMPPIGGTPPGEMPMNMPPGMSMGMGGPPPMPPLPPSGGPPPPPMPPM